MLPNLVIIGAQKCGTTSLHYYLNLHPEITMSAEKELNFFIKERNWDKGISWYEKQFHGETRIHGEASPNYTFYPQFSGVPKRMHAVIPDAKLIYILRDPIKRMVSAYMHAYADGYAPQFDQALLDFDDSNFTGRSKYYMQLHQYLECYPLSQILVLTQEEGRSRCIERFRGTTSSGNPIREWGRIHLQLCPKIGVHFWWQWSHKGAATVLQGQDQTNDKG